MNLINLTEDNYRRFGEYRYIVFGEKHYTNLDLLRYSRGMSEGLRALGLGRGDNVLVMLPNCPEILISYQAILRSGCVAVPVVAALTEGELEHILMNSGAVAIVTSSQLLPKIDLSRENVATLKYVIIIEPEHVPGTYNLWDLVDQAHDEHPPIPLRDDDLAVIIYTAGTTGTPKGVMLTHGNLYSNAVNAAAARSVKRSDVNLAALPLSHSFGITVMNTSLIFGNLWVLMPRFKVEETFRLIEKHRITNFPGVPAMFSLMLLASPELRRKNDLSSLQSVTSGSAPLPIETYRAFQKEFQCVISEGYGLSEASPVVSVHYSDREIRPGSVGQPIPGTEVRIVDESSREVPTREVGEIVVRGPNISPGYYKMPEETARTFRAGWLYTGDMGRMDEDGYLYIVERKKDIIIRGGFNIYPRDVEEVLLRHPEVKEAAVIGVSDPVMGEEVKAFIVLKGEKPPAEEEIIEFCWRHLSENKCPKMVRYLDALPKSPIGKVLRKELRKI